MQDYELMHRQTERRRSRAAAMFDDEEPDDDTLTVDQWRARARRRRDDVENAETRERLSNRRMFAAALDRSLS